MIKLYKGDCLEVMKTIDDNSIDAIITDPPYGTTQCKWDSVIPFDAMWLELNRIIKPNGAIVLFGSEPFSSALRMSNIKNYKYDWVWIKNTGTGIGYSKYMPMKWHENISVFYKKPPTYNKQETKTKSKHSLEHFKKGYTTKNSTETTITNKGLGGGGGGKKWKEKINPRSYLEFKTIHNRDKNKVHPTQKPVALMEYLIKTYTNEGETVLDFTMGSGSTGVACKNTNRKFIGIEQDENYFKIATERINKEDLFTQK